MTLSQLNALKRWHLKHGVRPVELTVCDLVIGAWVGGWMLLPSAVLLQTWEWLPLSLGMVLLPGAYRALRRHLHQRGVLRCDWLPAVSRS